MKQKNPKIELSPRAKLISRYNVGRANLLAMVLITLFNVIIALLGDGTYYLFTAFVPYYVVLDGMYSCGRLSPDWYEGDMSEYFFMDPSYLVTMIAFALVLLALYFLFWLLSKNRKSGWLIAALVLFGIDTLGLLYFYGLYIDILLDLLFHAWILGYLISAIVAAKKLKALPPDEENADTEGLVPETIEVKNGKTLDKIPANCFLGASLWRKQYESGALFLYRDRVIFRAHENATLPISLTFRYADIATTRPHKNLGASNGLWIVTADGREHRFALSHRDEVMKFLDRKIATFKNQA